MIQKLKRRFVALSMTALLVLLCAIIAGMNIVNYTAVVKEADETLELLAANSGTFPDMDFIGGFNRPPGFSPETPYESRYFSILIGPGGTVLQTDTSRIEAIDEEQAIAFAAKVLENGNSTGFLNHYRYLRCGEGIMTRIIFLDCGRKIDSFQTFLVSSILMALIGYALFFFVILYFSGRIIRPVAESYEKQKQFITDAGHEIKTPLTIIKADSDVLEIELGENEWLEDIQRQAQRLTDLTNDLVYLSRMEESGSNVPMIEFPFSDVVSEAAASFQTLAQTQNKEFTCAVTPMLCLTGNEKSIRQLVGILLDNAVKYAPEGGSISMTVDRQSHQIRMTVRNSTTAVISSDQLDRIFERFYRMDSSRSTQTGGYGIGLSIASAIVTAHSGKIWASAPDEYTMQITVVLPVS